MPKVGGRARKRKISLVLGVSLWTDFNPHHIPEKEDAFAVLIIQPTWNIRIGEDS
jgi:hypothetical protein